MSFEEAIGVGRALSGVQRAMLLNLDDWPDTDATIYNREELVWKELIYRTSWSPAYRLTDRGLAVRTALEMRALSDADLIRSYHESGGESLRAIAALREIEDRCLDL